MDFTNLSIGQTVLALVSNKIIKANVCKIISLRLRTTDEEKTVTKDTIDVVMIVPNYYGPSDEIEDQLYLKVKASRVYNSSHKSVDYELSGDTEKYIFGLTKEDIISRL